MQTLAEVRRQFLQSQDTQANVRGNFSEWHAGRRDFWIWALDVACPPVCARVARAAHRLDGCLLDGYRRAPHITLGICGFPAARSVAADSYTPEHLAAQLAALERLQPQVLTLELGAAASFRSAPFLHVADPQLRLDGLRAALSGPCEALRRDDFLPHVTIGLYAGAWASAEMARRLSAGGDEHALPLHIDRVCLMRYTAADIGGPLEILAEYRFGRGFRWCAGQCPDGFSAVCSSGSAGTMAADCID
jgi:2'-5' RNA ligase